MRTVVTVNINGLDMAYVAPAGVTSDQVLEEIKRFDDLRDFEEDNLLGIQTVKQFLGFKPLKTKTGKWYPKWKNK